MRPPVIAGRRSCERGDFREQGFTLVVRARQTHEHRILNFVNFTTTPFAFFFLTVITLTFFASFLRAVCKNCLISTISLGLQMLRGGGGRGTVSWRQGPEAGRPRGGARREQRPGDRYTKG